MTPLTRSGDQVLWGVTGEGPAPETVERLLRLLPAWFGIESSLLEYVEAARARPAYLARPATPVAGLQPGEPAGVALIARHFPAAAELYLIAVHPAAHRRGAGRALVAAAEADLIADGARFLQVKTLGPSHPDAGYALTRQFYASLGFTALEELPDLWPENPCLIMIKSLGAQPPERMTP